MTVEDHWSEGGLGDAVLDAFTGAEDRAPADIKTKVTKLAVHHMPGSATPDQEIEDAGISAADIVNAVKALLG